MSSRDLPGIASSASAEVEQTFRALADEWLDETAHLSDPVDKFMHPALVQIIGLGKPAVPLLLKEVQKMSGHWFYALEHINRMNPVPPEDQWSVEKTAAAWLTWGRSGRLI
jgi:cytochrome P450